MYYRHPKFQGKYGNNNNKKKKLLSSHSLWVDIRPVNWVGPAQPSTSPVRKIGPCAGPAHLIVGPGRPGPVYRVVLGHIYRPIRWAQPSPARSPGTARHGPKPRHDPARPSLALLQFIFFFIHKLIGCLPTCLIHSSVHHKYLSHHYILN